ncbi:ATP-dependent zinc metalloprotease FtsH [Candidatus Uhrbacteria bacterium]|nr:ATP-dependent zinc metalloprotease FtsH [Candidatus Uhrbacteria bacterium]
MPQTLRTVLLFVAALALVGAALAFIDVSPTKEIDVSTFARDIEEGDVASIVVRGGTLDVEMKDGSKATVQKEAGETLSELLTNVGVDPARIRDIRIEVKDPSSGAGFWATAILPNLLPILLLVGIMWFFLRQVQGQSNRAMMFGQSGAREIQKDEKAKVTFTDVAGVKEAKEELTEIVEFLRSPGKFVRLGAKIPKGVLLMGGPGTGKTLLARAVAGEAGVPFFHMSGSEFVEMFVGVGASRVRDLFAKAKKTAPCIVFIDEIDAVGRQRGSGLGGSHDEREQTLNQILVEMDGFEPNIGIIVMAATNRPDVLDPALLRPGRFDRRVVLDPPDLADREAILAIHAKDKPLAKGVSLRKLAERTPGFSGADLANLMNEAAILAARRDRTEVLEQDLLESIEKVMLGPERRSHILNEDERRVTAVHEAGHAVVAHLLPHADPVQKISIISRGRAAGYTIKLPIEDRKMRRRAEYVEDLAILLGGYAAEKTFFDDITTGASSDMKQATRLARNMVTQWGMSEALGPRVFGEQEDMIFLGREIHENRDYAEDTAKKIDTEIDALIAAALVRATDILTGQKDAVTRVADTLMEKETLERADFYATVGIPPANPKNALGAGIEERTA